MRKHRVAKIMRQNKIKAVRGYKAPRHIVGRPSIVAPNRLERQFTVDAPDRAWITDITYLRTFRGCQRTCAEEGLVAMGGLEPPTPAL